MHIVLTILKIILWIILILIALALLLILLVLLCPIRYKAKVQYTGKAKVVAKVRYLIVSVKIFFDQETKQTDTVIRVLGLRFKGGGHKKPTVTQEEVEAELAEHGTSYDEFAGMIPEEAGEETEQTNQIAQTDQTASEQTDNAEQIPLIDITKIGEVTYGEPEEQKISEDSSEFLDTLQDIDEERAEKVDFIARIIAKITGVIEKIAAKLSALSAKLWDKADAMADKVDEGLVKADQKLIKTERTIDRFIKFWELECTEKTKAYLVKYLKSLVKHVAPRKARGHAHYGFEEPYKTGTVTGYLSVFPCMYQRGLTLTPDFHEQVMDVDVTLKGHIVLGYLIRIVFNINLLKTWKAYKKMRAAEKAS